MKSIKVKIGALVLCCVLLVAVMIGTSSIINAKRVVSDYSQQLIQQQSAVKEGEINALLSRIEQSVQSLSDYSQSQLLDLNKFRTDRDYVREYTEALSSVALNSAQHTEGSMTVYIRYNPEFTEPTSGLFYTRDSANSSFQKLVPTDFSMYDSSDVAHVGWYYVPVQNGKPTWMSPYVNENINVKMISYVIPIQVGGVSVGVVGMDIDFSVVENLVQSTKLYETGYAYLTNDVGEPISGNAPDNASANWVLYNTKLQNDFQFVVAAPTNEINAESDALSRQISLLSLLGVVIALIFSYAVIQGIIKPLRELTVAAGKMAEGDLRVTLSCQSQDEVGLLAKNFQMIVERLQNYILYLQEITVSLQKLSQGDLNIALNLDYIGDFQTVKTALLSMANTLNQDMGQIKMAASQIAIGSEQAAQGAEILSQGSSEQSEYIDKLTDMVHNLSQKITTNAQGAEKVHSVAGKAGVDLQQNGMQMAEMVEAMRLIQISGEEIIRMTKVIDDIALQTDILALNASVEAARAGEAGKGFSIVAGEVKSLAVKSTSTAKNISELSKKTMSAISSGTRIANEAQESLKATAGGAKAVVDIVQQIVSDSQVQATAVAEILTGMDKITGIVHETSSTAEEGAASADALSSQAQIMNTLVEKFRLQKTNTLEIE